jgi:hypothetical protein
MEVVECDLYLPEGEVLSFTANDTPSKLYQKQVKKIVVENDLNILEVQHLDGKHEVFVRIPYSYTIPGNWWEAEAKS